MTRRGLAWLALPVTTLLLLLMTPAPGLADGGSAPASAETWWPAPCATGEITSYSVDASGPYPTVSLKGWIKPCAETVTTNGFAVMQHTPDANAVRALLPYESMSEQTSFTTVIDYTAANRDLWAQHGGLRGLCLVSSYQNWLSCLSVELDADGVPHIAPARPDFEGLEAAVVSGSPWGVWYPNPSCGTCA